MMKSADELFKSDSAARNYSADDADTPRVYTIRSHTGHANNITSFIKPVGAAPRRKCHGTRHASDAFR